MQFKDAAYEILKEAGTPLHYNEITDLAKKKGILDTAGQTPHATMGALLYTDTLKENSRFRRGDEKGTFVLQVAASKGIKQQIESIQKQIRQDLRKYLLKVHPQKFEELIRSLLEEMGFDEAETTAYRNDQGVDVRGILRTNPLSTTKVAIQAKRWTANVGSSVVRDLRGSLRVADAEQGLIITPSDFTLDARNESEASGKTPITLINGFQLVDLLIQYQVGVKQEQYTVPSIDSEYWTEVLGVQLDEQDETENKKSRTAKIRFPITIRAQHNGETFVGELLNLEGHVRWNGQQYGTPSGAAKAVATDWKEVNGWDFWRYLNPSNGKWEKLGKLR